MKPNVFLSVVCLFVNSILYAQLSSKPNIVIIVADDLGWGDVGFHDADIRTPHIDNLAKEGVVLKRFYTSPICSPTRAGIMTGRYPERMGLRDNVIAPWLDFGVDSSETFLPQMLATAGYRNRAAIGKWHLGHSRKRYLPLSRGFTHFYGHYNGAIDYFTHKREGELDWHNDWNTSYDKGYSTDLISAEAIKCIRKYKEEGPFFLYIAYNAPHGPLQAKKEDLLKYGYDPSRPVFGNDGSQKEQGRGNTKRQTYAAMVTGMDEGIGRILSAIREAGIESNTLVLFQSDNGAEPSAGGSSGALRGHKFQEWEGGVRSPAVIKWPKAIKGGWTSEQLCGYIDIAPTICAIAGVSASPSKEYDGINIASSLLDKGSNLSRQFYLGHGSIIVDDWKLVKAGGGAGKISEKEDFLFHIVKDPLEKNDVKDQHPLRYKEMLSAIQPYQEIKSAVKVPPYGQGRKTFKAPHEWNVQAE